MIYIYKYRKWSSSSGSRGSVIYYILCWWSLSCCSLTYDTTVIRAQAVLAPPIIVWWVTDSYYVLLLCVRGPSATLRVEMLRLWVTRTGRLVWNTRLHTCSYSYHMMISYVKHFIQYDIQQSVIAFLSRSDRDTEGDIRRWLGKVDTWRDKTNKI